jgi:hypothetical protein
VTRLLPASRDGGGPRPPCLLAWGSRSCASLLFFLSCFSPAHQPAAAIPPRRRRKRAARHRRAPTAAPRPPTPPRRCPRAPSLIRLMRRSWAAGPRAHTSTAWRRTVAAWRASATIPRNAPAAGRWSLPAARRALAARAASHAATGACPTSSALRAAASVRRPRPHRVCPRHAGASRRRRGALSSRAAPAGCDRSSVIHDRRRCDG